MAAPNGLMANGEQWFAFVSSGAVSAKDRLTFDGPYRLLNGIEIAQNKAKFTSGSRFPFVPSSFAGSVHITSKEAESYRGSG